MTGEFEERVKKLKLDPKFEKYILDMFEEASNEDPCIKCASKGDCENFKWHKKYLNTGDNENCKSCGNCCP